MNKILFQNVIKQLLNITIAMVTLLIVFALSTPTQLLINYQRDFKYTTMYFSALLPVELLSIFLLILILIKNLNFSSVLNKTAISILILNGYSFYLLSNYYPFFILDGSEHSYLYGLIYQVVLSIGNYLTCLYGFYFSYKTLFGDSYKS